MFFSEDYVRLCKKIRNINIRIQEFAFPREDTID